MNSEEFRTHGYEIIDWIADYLENADRYPVMSRSRPGEIKALIPDTAPENGESMDTILEDFRRDILPGVTHWNHPRFFAYFPANNSGPSILGEMLSAGLGVNAMLWQTSPAATELEEKVMDWLGELISLPEGFHGVIQDTASTTTLCALVCAREKATSFAVNAAGPAGLAGAGPLRIYTSREAHSSVLKGAKIAGFGAENVVQVDIDAERAMDPVDLKPGSRPTCTMASSPAALWPRWGRPGVRPSIPCPSSARWRKNTTCGCTWTPPWLAVRPSCLKCVGSWTEWSTPIRSSSTPTSGC